MTEFLPQSPASSIVVIVIIVRHEELVLLEERGHLFADPSADADSREYGDEELEEAEPRRRLRLLHQRPRVESGARPRLLFRRRRHPEGWRRGRRQGHRWPGRSRGRHEQSPAHLLELEAPRPHAGICLLLVLVQRYSEQLCSWQAVEVEIDRLCVLGSAVARVCEIRPAAL